MLNIMKKGEPPSVSILLNKDLWGSYLNLLFFFLDATTILKIAHAPGQIQLTSVLLSQSKIISFSSSSTQFISIETWINPIGMAVTRVPTLQELRASIPKHCFQRNEARFVLSILKSFAVLAPTIYAATLIPVSWLWLPAWFIYSIICGTAAFGIWILGHECGHDVFSSNKILNHSVGYVLHTILLVPYFSWRWSHYYHHIKNNHIEQGESHVPYKFGEPRSLTYMQIKETLGKFYPAFQALVVLGPGWLSYLCGGISGGPARGKTSHFIVPNGLFPENKVAEVHVSTLGLIVVLGLLFKLGTIYGYAFVFLMYFPSWMVCNAWLSLVTLLQHTQKQVRWYDDRNWNWVRGALGTIDRNYPWIIDEIHHYIGTTHVMHHLFPQVPHYHAKQATVALAKKLGSLYNRDSQPFYISFYRCCGLLYTVDQGDGSWAFRQG